MESIHFSSPNRRSEIAKQIDEQATLLIDALTNHRKLLRFGDKTKMLLDMGDSLVSTIRVMTRSNYDLMALSNGVTETGIPWLIRVISRQICSLLENATKEQLVTSADTLRKLAVVLEEIVNEEING